MASFSKAAAVVAGFAAGAAVANKISNLVSGPQQAFNKLKFGDVTGKASKAGFKPITKFKKNDFPNSPSTFAAQATSRENADRENFEVLTYPADIGKYFVKFSFISYVKEAALKLSKDEPTLVVVLPIPSNLTENFSVSYNDAKLGPIAGPIVEGATQGAAKAASEGKGAGGQVVGAAVGAGKAAGSNLGASAYVLAREKVQKSSETLGANLDRATGVVPNPHLAAIFQDIGLREHSFSFRFSPNNSKENETLKKIIKKVKRRMLPGTGAGDGQTGPLFSFPDVVDISFGPKDELPYKIKRCVMTSMAVNYAPNGLPSFFKDGNPTDVEITMSFKEIRTFTREDLQDKETSFTNAQVDVL